MEEMENRQAASEEERSEQTLPEEDLPEERPEEQLPETFTPRPLGLRILAWLLAILVIIGLGLYYYHIMMGK